MVDEPALVQALEAGKIRGAALDVFAVEPLPPAHPFYKMENVCCRHTPRITFRISFIWRSKVSWKICVVFGPMSRC